VSGSSPHCPPWAFWERKAEREDAAPLTGPEVRHLLRLDRLGRMPPKEDSREL
jgi:hypothetical protein